jgi:hypothetical protein
MNPKAMALMAKNGGLLTSWEAYDCDLFPEDVRADIRHGRLVSVKRGVYADAELWAALDGPSRHRLRTRAAMKLMRRHHVASHDSSAYEHRLEILEPPEPFVHITRQGVTNAWTKAGVKHHLARFRPEQVLTIDGIGVLDLPRTAVDIARELGPPYGEIACDAVLRRGVPRSALHSALEVMEFWPHIRRTRHAVDFADPGAETLIETMGRILVAEAGLGPIETQFPVQLSNSKVKWCDMRVGCHLIEVGGKVKYTPVEEGGLAVETPTAVVWAEKKRDRDINAEGLGVSHLVYADFWPPARAAAKKRLLAEYQDTVARFGSVLPERIAQAAAQLRGQRRA